jgi:large subunit ribosomal protein L22
MGRGNRIVKKTSHITVVVQDYEGETKVKPHGTKAKPRPTLSAPGKKGKKAPVAAAKPVAEKAGAEEPIVEPGPTEVVDTQVEETAAEMAQEATPVTESEAPEEQGSTEPAAEDAHSTAPAEEAAGEADEKGAE